MTSCVNNQDVYEVFGNAPWPAQTNDEGLRVGSAVSGDNRCQVQAKSASTLYLKTEDFIWLELSLVPEIEKVYIDAKSNSFDVLIIVNDRNAETRDRIYDRELAVISHFPHQDFAFRILPRLGLPLSELISNSERPTYTRR